MKRSLCLMALLLSACHAAAPQVSKPKVIQVGGGSALKPIDIVAYEDDDDQRSYIVAIGSNLHRVRDCPSEPKLWAMIDRDAHPLDQQSMEALLAEPSFGYVERPDLSCTSLGDELNTGLYYNGDTYYVPTGVSQEYYGIKEGNAGCAFGFVNQVFNLNERTDQAIESSPPVGSTLIPLSCQANSKGSYRLEFISGAGTSFAFRDLLILSFEPFDQPDQTIRIPIHRINGQFIEGSVARNNVLEALRPTFGIQTIEPAEFQTLLKVRNKTFLDLCLNDCDTFQPKHQFANGTFTLSNAVGLEAIGIPDLNGRDTVQWGKSGSPDFVFTGCDSNFFKRFGLPVQTTKWIQTLKAQINQPALGNAQAFSCPAAQNLNVCTVVLLDNSFTVSGLMDKINNPTDCAGKETMDVLFDSNVVVEGSTPLVLNSNQFKTVTLRPYVRTDRKRLTYRYDCDKKPEGCNSSALEQPAFLISGSSQVVFENLDLSADVKSVALEPAKSSPPMVTVLATGANRVTLRKSSILRSAPRGKNLWSKGLKLAPTVTTQRALVNCQGCRIEAEDIAIDADRSQLLIRNAQLSSLTDVLYLRGGTQAVVHASRLTGNRLMTLASEARVFGHTLQLDTAPPLSKLPNAKWNSFRLTTSLPRDGAAIELSTSEFHGLPAEKLITYDFVEFQDPTEVATMRLNAMKFFRFDETGKESLLVNSYEDLHPFLKCNGNGKLLYMLDNHCIR